VPEQNEYITFASDADYDAIKDSDDDTLEFTGKYGGWYEEI